MTHREVLLAYLKTLLDGVGGASAHRSREVAVTRGEGVVIVIRPEEEQVETRGSAPLLTLRDLTVVITVTSRGEVPELVADPVIEAIHAALMADQTLGGRCARITDGSTRFDFEQADQTALATELRYVIRYMTPAATLTAQA